MKTDVGLVGLDELCFVWPDALLVIEEFGQKWLETEDIREVYNALKREELDLWLATRDNQIDLVGICGGEFAKGEKLYHIYWVGGKGLKRHLKEGLTKVERYAAFNQVKEVILEGRVGWARVLRSHGYGVQQRLAKNVRILWSN